MLTRYANCGLVKLAEEMEYVDPKYGAECKKRPEKPGAVILTALRAITGLSRKGFSMDPIKKLSELADRLDREEE